MGVLNTYPQAYVPTSSDDENEEIYDTLDYQAKKQKIIEDLRWIKKDTFRQTVNKFHPNFQEKYKTNEFDYSKTKGGRNFWDKLKERIKDFFDLVFGWDKNHKLGKATDIAINVISILIVLFVIYLLVRVIMRHEGNWFFQGKNEKIEIDVNNLEQMIQYADFEKMIAEMEEKGDTRQSIRLYYIWLLRWLKEKNHIEWHQQKTNADYQNEINDANLKEKFVYLSYLYNYIWYGEFSITDSDYITAKQAFLTHLKSSN